MTADARVGAWNVVFVAGRSGIAAESRIAVLHLLRVLPSSAAPAAVSSTYSVHTL